MEKDVKRLKETPDKEDAFDTQSKVCLLLALLLKTQFIDSLSVCR